MDSRDMRPKPRSLLQISGNEARRLAVTASFGRSLPGSAAVLRNVGLLQLDPLTRVDKAHRLTCLARMSATAAARNIDGPLWQDGEASAFETWVHAGCLVPVEDWPLLRIARDQIRHSPGGPPPSLLAEVRATVGAFPAGATISDIEAPGHRTAGWNWSDRKHAVEHMLRTGDLVCTTRRGNRRVYDLPERRIPSQYLNAADMSDEETLAALASRAIAAMAVATTDDVARYYNVSATQAEVGLEAAGLVQARVEGWSSPGWVQPSGSGLPGTGLLGTDLGAQSHAPVLVGPFDNLIWDRKRVRRIFDFDYVFEAYKPAAQRSYGYYVLALLDNYRLTGRADVRRDRDRLTIVAAYPEPAESVSQFSASIDAALMRLQCQLELTSPE